MVFSELPDMSDPSLDFAQQHQREVNRAHSHLLPLRSFTHLHLTSSPSLLHILTSHLLPLPSFTHSHPTSLPFPPSHTHIPPLLPFPPSHTHIPPPLLHTLIYHLLSPSLLMSLHIKFCQIGHLYSNSHSALTTYLPPSITIPVLVSL